MKELKWLLFVIWNCLEVLKGDASSWTVDIPESVSGLLGSCVVIPCLYNYPELSQESSEYTGIWADESHHLIYHPDSSKVQISYRHRTQLLGNLRQKNCSLKIDPLQSTDMGPFHFRIEMDGANKYSYLQSKVSITSIASPEPITFSMKEVIKQGASVTASCSVTHSCPSDPPEFTWNLSGSIHVHSTMLSKGLWTVTSMLTFEPIPADHKRLIECSVKYRGGQTQKSSKTLRVKYAPENVTVDYIPSVREGETVELRCRSSSNPAANSYHWYSSNGTLLNQGHMYQLPNVSRHTGAFYCIAANTEGQGSSTLVRLNVLYPPEIKEDSYCLTKETLVTCVCIVDSWPPSTVRWSLPGRIVKSHKEEQNGSITTGTLLRELGFAELVQCLANNSQGNDIFTISTPSASSVHGKMLILYITIGLASSMTVVIFVTVLCLSKKWKSHDDDQPCPVVQKDDFAAVTYPSKYPTETRKSAKSGKKTFSNAYTNEHIYGNMEDGNMETYECVTDDEAVYANV